MKFDFACDSHIHILESSATVAHYRQIQLKLGLARAVVVQPRAYGTDNSITLEAIAKLGIENARGIAVVHPTVGNYELAKLHAGGIRGLRMSLYTPENAAVSFEMLEPLARIAYGLGWHVQLHWTADQMVQYAPRLLELPTTFVFDHLARLPVSSDAQGTRQAAFAVVRELMQQGRAWVKLSGAYLNTALPHGHGYGDLQSMAEAWIKLAPDRLVWGSDWPHVTEAKHTPNDQELFDLLHQWAGDEATAQRILVDNPAKLYGF
ncbi:MAG: hypothetical protein RLY82_782 [Pseudomonadota bacterium]|jgi:predicted TIM-barrel fold metal-dependent hydrolase